MGCQERRRRLSDFAPRSVGGARFPVLRPRLGRGSGLLSVQKVSPGLLQLPLVAFSSHRIGQGVEPLREEQRLLRLRAPRRRRHTIESSIFRRVCGGCFACRHCRAGAFEVLTRRDETQVVSRRDRGPGDCRAIRGVEGMNATEDSRFARAAPEAFQSLVAPADGISVIRQARRLTANREGGCYLAPVGTLQANRASSLLVRRARQSLPFRRG